MERLDDCRGLVANLYLTLHIERVGGGENSLLALTGHLMCCTALDRKGGSEYTDILVSLAEDLTWIRSPPARPSTFAHRCLLASNWPPSAAPLPGICGP